MSDKASEARELRTISVSSKAAKRSVHDDQGRARVENRTEELLTDLEQEVRQDGNDPDILAAIESERRAVHET